MSALAFGHYEDPHVPSFRLCACESGRRSVGTIVGAIWVLGRATLSQNHANSVHANGSGTRSAQNCFVTALVRDARLFHGRPHLDKQVRYRLMDS